MNKDLASEQKEAIDYWMRLNGFPVMQMIDIESMMGGVGEARCRKIADALKKPTSSPGRWFMSKQTDHNFQFEPSYVYDAWWVAHNVSTSTYAAAARSIGNLDKKLTVGDVGGSIFSAEILRELGVRNVNIYNLPGTIQWDFFNWRIEDEYHSGDIELFDDSRIADFKRKSDMLIMSEYLEHFEDVDAEMQKWKNASKIVVANGFCVAAHGHYIPLRINGTDASDRPSADAAFNELAVKLGYLITKVPYIRKNVLILER